MSEIQKIVKHTQNPISDNINRLIQLFPDVATETYDAKTGETKQAINFDALRNKIGYDGEPARERYQFTWPGKHKAKVEAYTPISKTLIPDIDRSVDWDNTQNLYIEGDNLDALKILRESYAGKIKLIYIDPPYNTGHDFIYKDNFKKSRDADRAENGDFDSNGNRLVPNLESNGRFHSDWCSMIYPRLLLARDLLSADGIICISISDGENSNLRKICDEIFGANNFITQFVWEKTQHFGRQTKNSYNNVDYILCYGKSIFDDGLKRLLVEKKRGNLSDAPLYNATNRAKTLCFPPQSVSFKIADGVYKKSSDNKYSLVEPVTVTNGKNSNELHIKLRSRWSQKTVNEYLEHGTTFIIKSEQFAIRAIYDKTKTTFDAPRQLLISNQNNTVKTVSRYGTRIDTSENASSYLATLLGTNCFSYPKPVSLIEYIISILWNPQNNTFDDDGIVLDFFSGSATTAEAVLRANAADNGHRKFIMVQYPETISNSYPGFSNICELGQERIRRVGKNIQDEVVTHTSDDQIQGTKSNKRPLPDTGFRVFKIKSSNFKNLRKSASTITQDQLEFDIDEVKADRTSIDLLFEVLPRLQLEFNASIEQLTGSTFDDYIVYNVNHGQLLACFDRNVSRELIYSMATYTPRPSYVVISENGLIDSASKTNSLEIFKQLANSTDGQTQFRIV